MKEKDFGLHLMKCKKDYSPFCKGGDNDFYKGYYYKVNLYEGYAEDSEGICWNIDNIHYYFKELNLFDKCLVKLFYKI